MQQFSRIAESVRLNMVIPTQSLLSIQKSLVIFNDSLIKQIENFANTALIARGMFADFESYHTRIIRSLNVDIASLGKAVQFTTSELIDFEFQDITKHEDRIIATSEASQIRTIDGYVMVNKASLSFFFTELQATRSEVAELKKLMQNSIQTGISKVEYADAAFKRESSKLILKGYEVIIKGSFQSKFCDVFFNSADNFFKKWDIDDFVYEAFGARPVEEGTEEQWITKIRSYVFQLNRKIESATLRQITDFFIYLDLHVYINPKYISNP